MFSSDKVSYWKKAPSGKCHCCYAVVSWISPPRNPYRLLEDEVVAYQATLPLPDPAWPVDVRMLLDALHERLFEAGVRMGNLQRQCGLCDHNISMCFAKYVGMTPKKYRLPHQMTLAKRLLRDARLKQVLITQIALAIGYENLRVFSRAFKRRMGCSPSDYRASN